jgi:hypothetical protein
LSVTSRCEPQFLKQLAHQPQCRLGISPTLNEHLEDLALVVDGAPQVHPFPGDPDDHLVEVPSRARAWAGLPRRGVSGFADYWTFAPD